MDSPNTSFAMGVDLGTTFSGAAIFLKNKIEPIYDENDNVMIPSCVFFHPKSTSIHVGTEAEKYGAKYPKNLLFDMKRIIGRKFHDIHVQQLIKSNEYPFKIVSGSEDKAEIELEHNKTIVRKAPEEVSAEILKYLRKSASIFVGTSVTDAVISVPAYFSNAQRKATREAAKIAGLRVLKLIAEPVAAAVYYAEDRLNDKATLLVFDFGGGTLDVSIIEADQKTFEVKCVEGDTFLGGRDFDKIIMEKFKMEMVKKHGEEVKEKFDDKRLQKIRKQCRELKISLSVKKQSVTEPIDVNDELELYLTLKRTDFENDAAVLIQRARQVVEKCFLSAGLTKNDITDVILVGGTTRIPKVKEMLSSYFQDTKLRTNLNPTEAVARGAAIQGTNSHEFDKYKVTEVTPLSLGLGLRGDVMEVVIKKNTHLPVKSKSTKLCTIRNNQKSVMFNIFEGERKNCNYNNLLGSFTIHDLSPGKAGDVQLEATYLLNEDGILTVEAHEVINSNKRNKVAVTVGEFRLCENEIKNITDEAKKNKEEDEIFIKNVQLKYKFEMICEHILYDLNKLPAEEDRFFVESKCKKMKSFLKDPKNLEFVVMQKEFNTFTNTVKGLVDKHIDIQFLEEEADPMNSSTELEISQIITSLEKVPKKKM